MKQPPKLARKLFAVMSGAANVDDLLGDMDEWFHENTKTRSLVSARWIYWKQVLSLSFSYALRKRRRDARHPVFATWVSFGMLNNYVKVALRNIYQYKYFSIINFFGLALGMSVSLLLISLFAYVNTYDNYHTNGDRIYSVYSSVTNGPEQTDFATAPIALADKLGAELPSVSKVLPVVKAYHSVVRKTESIPVKAYYAGSDFFDFFSFSFIRGNGTVLGKPNHVVLNERTARKLFGDADPMGEMIELGGGVLMQVGGVIHDQKRTHLNFDMVIPIASLPPKHADFKNDWVEFSNQYLYVRLTEEADEGDVQRYLDRMAGQQYAASAVKVSFDTRNLTAIAIDKDLRNEIGEKWEASGFLMFAIFAALILFPACFNYANISIARAMGRAKEIALRKTVGGVRSQIFLQFITETVVIVLLSLVGAMLIFFLIRSEFQQMLVSGSSLDLTLSPRLFLWFLLFAILTGLATGVFPALYFARMNPIEAFKSRVVTRAAFISLRKGLTIFQFVLSFGFILSLFAVGRQYRYAMNFDFGFRKEQIIDVSLQDVKAHQFMAAVAPLPSVVTMSQSSGIMGVTSSHAWLKDIRSDSLETAQMFVDRNYIYNLALTFVAGSNFPNELWSRERYIVVNEEFLRVRNIKAPADALGRIYSVEGNDLEVIGVLKDFHFAPINIPIRDFIFRENPAYCTYVNLRVTPGDSYDIVSELEGAWKQLPTDKKFVARYFEDEIYEAYTVYVVMLKIIGFMGVLAITISVLGLVGMVVFTAQSRTREVGIRKAMGAGVQSMMLLLSRDYLMMLGWAIVIGTPLTILLLNWIMPHIQYYHASVSVWDVVLSVLLLLTFGVSAMTIETYKTATASPATTLKCE